MRLVEFSDKFQYNIIETESELKENVNNDIYELNLEEETESLIEGVDILDIDLSEMIVAIEVGFRKD